jgi:hypothetical protein
VDTAEIIGATSGDVPITKPLQVLFAKTQTPAEPNSQTPSEAAPALPVARQQVKDYIFELKECKLSGDEITCRILITNLASDRELAIFGKSFSKYCRIIDDAGNEYPVDADRMLLGSSRESMSSVRSILVSGVATNTMLGFPNISPKVRSIRLLELGCADENYKVFVVQFRNIPLTKER